MSFAKVKLAAHGVVKKQQVFPPLQGPYVSLFAPPTSPPFSVSAGPTTIGFDPNFQAIMLQMMLDRLVLSLSVGSGGVRAEKISSTDSYATEINQSTLASAIAARTAKMFYYLQQCFAKWERAGTPQIGLCVKGPQWPAMREGLSMPIIQLSHAWKQFMFVTLVCSCTTTVRT